MLDMCSNEVLNAKINAMEEADKVRDEQNKLDHAAIFKLVKEIREDIKCMPEKFVTRLEFKAVVAVVSFSAIILWIIAFFIWK